MEISVFFWQPTATTTPTSRNIIHEYPRISPDIHEYPRISTSIHPKFGGLLTSWQAYLRPTRMLMAPSSKRETRLCWAGANQRSGRTRWPRGGMRGRRMPARSLKSMSTIMAGMERNSSSWVVETELKNYLANTQKNAPPRELFAKKKPKGHVAYLTSPPLLWSVFCWLDLCQNSRADI